MAMYYHFASVNLVKEALVNSVPSLNMYEVDFEKIQDYYSSELISFRSSIKSIDFLLLSRHLSDYGIYHLSEFAFYIFAIQIEEGVEQVIVFSPAPILNCIRQINAHKQDIEGADQDEYDKLIQLEVMLEQAVKNQDAILVQHSG